MARKSSSSEIPASTAEGAAAADRIRRAGVDLFSRFGYHGTSMRALANAVNLEAASIYHHFPSKQDILADIVDRTVDELLAGMQRVLDGNGDHCQRLAGLVRFHVLYHVEKQKEAFISHSELRSLSPANRERNNTKRDRYERTLRTFLQSGVDAGEFQIRDVPMTTIAVLMMCSGVSDWFTGHGRLSGEQIADEYTHLVLHLVTGHGRDGPQRRSSRSGTGSAAGSRREGSTGHAARRQPTRPQGHRTVLDVGRPATGSTSNQPEGGV